jgi:hypothetical protein
MAQTVDGLPNSGRTSFFNFQYEQTLSAPRGRDLAREMMQYCDDDLTLLVGWFSGRQLDMSLPISISINNVATDAAGNPTQFVGGHWMGAALIPLQVTINIGELPMASGTPVQLARYLLIAEVSEMYMRAFDQYGTYPWFRFGEGNKGEGLSRFLGAEFLQRAYPGLPSMPTLAIPGGTWNVSALWLNSDRVNYLEVNDEDIQPDAVTGCAALFLCYLHDQLGFSVQEIINAGAGHLSNIYENLTEERWTNAWPSFSGIVNTNYPPSHNGISLSYKPAFESVFPVSSLIDLVIPGLMTWNPPTQPTGVIVVDPSAQVALTVDIASSEPSIIAPSTVTVAAMARNAFFPLHVIPQPAGFSRTRVTLTANYAGNSLAADVDVVSPDSISLPPLEIDVDRSDDPCRTPLVSGTSAAFVVRNLQVIGDPSGAVYKWTVTGATPDAVDSERLVIPQLPAEGSEVSLALVVTNRDDLKAAGNLTFQVRGVPGLEDLNAELRCRVNRLVNAATITLYRPGKGPVELEKQITVLEDLMREASQVAKEIGQHGVG